MKYLIFLLITGYSLNTYSQTQDNFSLINTGGGYKSLSSVLPGGGIGICYRMIKDEKINIGLDFGVGRNDWILTFRIGESFSR